MYCYNLRVCPKQKKYKEKFRNCYNSSSKIPPQPYNPIIPCPPPPPLCCGNTTGSLLKCLMDKTDFTCCFDCECQYDRSYRRCCNDYERCECEVYKCGCNVNNYRDSYRHGCDCYEKYDKKPCLCREL